MTPAPSNELPNAGQRIEPIGGLIGATLPAVGSYVHMTDGTSRRILKTEETIHTDSNRVMLTVTVILEPDAVRWLGVPGQEQ